jgi:hypothetical protein
MTGWFAIGLDLRSRIKNFFFAFFILVWAAGHGFIALSEIPDFYRLYGTLLDNLDGRN